MAPLSSETLLENDLGEQGERDASRPRTRSALHNIRFSRSLLILALIGLLLSLAVAAAGWRYWRNRKAGPRTTNETIVLPLLPPVPGLWRTENAFPDLKFAEPVFLTFAPSLPDRLFVLERRGTIQAVQQVQETRTKTTLLDISSQVISTPDGDNGALGLALHPNFGKSGSPERGYFYLLYTAKVGRQRYNRLSRFTLADGQTAADPATELVLIDQLDENEWHDGGPLCFGLDGFLYIGMGDEGYADDHYQNAQRIDKDLFAGVLRIDVDCRGGGTSHPIRRQPATGKTAGYYIPSDNPFVGRDALEEFWAIGLRNPYRMSFDRATGTLWAGDVGQNAREEICLITKGSNHQWSYREGNVPFERSYLQGRRPEELIGVETAPLFEYPHLNANYCVIGGYVYRGQQLPELAGKYIYGDNVSGRVWALEYDPEQRRVMSNVELFDLPVTSKSGLSSFGEDRDGELYLCVLGTHNGEDGTILKLVRNATAQTTSSPLSGAGEASTTSSPLPVAGEESGVRRDTPQNPAPTNDENLPKLLSQAGIFADLATFTPNPGLIPYEVNSPLWSDGAAKRRWMMIPGDGADPDAKHDRIQRTPDGRWAFPVGSVFIKHFELPLDHANPDLTRRLETRVLVCDATGGAYGFTYRWNEAGDDAELLSGPLKESFEIRLAGGGTRTQTWTYPSRADCLACHTPSAGYVLGVKASQLHRPGPSPRGGRTDNQLRALNDAGFFSPPLDDAELAAIPRLVSLAETHAPLADRVRSYLDANCANCHRPGGVRANFDARFETPLAEQNLLGGTLQKDLGFPDARVVRPREAHKSMLLMRMLDATHRMPPLGVTERDSAAISAVCDWIDSLPAESPRPSDH